MKVNLNREEVLNKLDVLLKEYENNIFFKQKIKELQSEIISLEPYIVVVGQFSVGKSEFINALLKENLLSAHSTETTKIITKIKHSKNERIEVKHLDNRNETKELNIENINQTTTFDGSKSKSVREITIYKNLEFLDGNISIVDSPGLNSMNDGALETTTNLLKYASAVVYLFNIQKGLDTIDDQLLSKLNQTNTNIILVGNKKDTISDISIKEVLDETLQRVQSYDLSEIYAVSAKKALEGFQEKSLEKIHASGIDKTKKAITDYILSGKAYLDQEKHIITLFDQLNENIFEFEKSVSNQKNNMNRKRQRLIDITKLQYEELIENGKQRINNRKSLLQDINQDCQNEIEKTISKYRRVIKKEILKKRETLGKKAINHLEVKEAIEILKKLTQSVISKMNELVDEVNLLLKNYINLITKIVNEDRNDIVETLKIENEKLELKWDRLKFESFKVNITEDFKIKDFIEFFDKKEKNLEENFKRIETSINSSLKNNRVELEEVFDEKDLLEKKLKKNAGKNQKIPSYEEKKVKEKVAWFFSKTTIVDNRDEIEQMVREVKDERDKLYLDKREIDLKISLLTKEMNELKEQKKTNSEELHRKKEELKDQLIEEALNIYFHQNNRFDKSIKEMNQEIMDYWQNFKYSAQSQYDDYLKYYRKTYEKFIKESLEKELTKIEGLKYE